MATKLKDKNKQKDQNPASKIVSQGTTTVCTILVPEDKIVVKEDVAAFKAEVESLEKAGFGLDLDPQPDGSILMEAQESKLSHWDARHESFKVIPPAWAKKTVVTKPYQPPIKGQE